MHTSGPKLRRLWSPISGARIRKSYLTIDSSWKKTKTRAYRFRYFRHSAQGEEPLNTGGGRVFSFDATVGLLATRWRLWDRGESWILRLAFVVWVEWYEENEWHRNRIRVRGLTRWVAILGIWCVLLPKRVPFRSGRYQKVVRHDRFVIKRNDIGIGTWTWWIEIIGSGEPEQSRLVIRGHRAQRQCSPALALNSRLG